MKKILLLVVVALGIAGIIVFQINTNTTIALNDSWAENTVTKDSISYKINLFGIFPMGKARFYAPIEEQYNGENAYHLRAVAVSLDYFSLFFKGSAELDSFVDLRELTPAMFRQKILIKGKPDMVREVTYDQKNGIINTFKGERAIPPDTLEPLSAMQALRRMDFNTVNNFEMNINTNQKNYLLQGTAKKQILVKNKKSYTVVRVKATIRRADKNNPYHRTKMEMYLLQDQGNLPFMINVVASGVFINVRLSE